MDIGHKIFRRHTFRTSGIKGHPINSFIVRKTPKGHGLKKTIEGDIKQGDKVIIVDDVVTTGASTIEAIRKAKEYGLEIVKVIVLVDRQEGGREKIENERFEFESIVTKEELIHAYNCLTRNAKRIKNRR